MLSGLGSILLTCPHINEKIKGNIASSAARNNYMEFICYHLASWIYFHPSNTKNLHQLPSVSLSNKSAAWNHIVLIYSSAFTICRASASRSIMNQLNLTSLSLSDLINKCTSHHKWCPAQCVCVSRALWCNTSRHMTQPTLKLCDNRRATSLPQQSWWSIYDP